jgi:hypothetical protein
MPIRCSSRAASFVVAAVCLSASGLAVAPLRAQSLADVAKKEEERRQKGPEPKKVYTNKDLKGSAADAPPPVARDTPAAEAPKESSTDAKAKDGKGAASGDKDSTKDSSKDPAYWSGRLKALQAKLDQDQAFAEAMQTRINALTTDAVNRDDPIQRGKLERDRQKAIADLAGLNTSIAASKKAIADLHEQARRAGVPPGWLR